MTALRDDIARLIDKHSGVMTGEELAEAVLAARGSVADGIERYRLASAQDCLPDTISSTCSTG
jgi:hypothetical protein